MMSNRPDLKFGPGTSIGFTPTGIAAFTNLRPAAVVRELIQNALDAAREASERTAFVCFRLTRKNTNTIPGIRSYGKALESAVKTHKEMMGGDLPRQAELVVSTIQDALSKNTQDILSVLDNGIGLNERRMNALLSDGVSAKHGNATGTYGNGHAVAIPASDLRYILYGGVTDNGRQIGAGHAVLASHTGTGKTTYLCAGHGFFVLKFRNGKDGKLYDYAKAQAIPKLIAGDLKNIRETYRHGTVVVIPAFNHFREGTPHSGTWWRKPQRATSSKRSKKNSSRCRWKTCDPGKTPFPKFSTTPRSAVRWKPIGKINALEPSSVARKPSKRTKFCALEKATPCKPRWVSSASSSLHGPLGTPASTSAGTACGSLMTKQSPDFTTSSGTALPSMRCFFSTRTREKICTGSSETLKVPCTTV